ncbi:PDZ domain-containing protein 9 [Sphaerodactylus townsendi]|uniref:PDZ domain-containing protein 9 n=1 Tax=Sphaerodactylus townsendi TaxID=933632 RepID=UPI002025D8AE|nr:PDZ domain-containing protein 9 [Sphaerodactylus townsendi]
MEKDGLGFIIIQNGPYLQLTGLVENSAAARDGKLQEGDVFLKIGHANVLGWTLRELRQLLQGTPIGTALQIQVYRDFLALPSRWTSVMDHIPEKSGTNSASDVSEESWTSSEGTDEPEDHTQETDSEGDRQTTPDSRAVQEENVAPDPAPPIKTVHYQDTCEEPEGAKATRHAPATQMSHFGPSPQPQFISRDWHFFERKKHTFTVGSDIGCDIMIHKDHREKSRWSSPYWTMPKANIASSSSSSSLSEVFWLTDSAEDRE